MAGQVFKVSTLIDGAAIGARQRLIIGLCAAVVFLDGFDAQAIGFVAPALIRSWGLERHELTPVFSMGLVGLMLGALFIAPLADRLGRRPVIIASTLLFGAFSLATAWASSIDQLVVLRFLTGLGLGGCMPNAIALTSEYSPARRRSLLVMLMFSGFTLGSLVGGLISAEIVPTYGWQAVFVAGGALPLLLTPLLWCVLPESLRFLTVAGAQPERIAHELRKIDPDVEIPPGTRFTIDEAPSVRGSVRRLFADGRAMRTVLLWLVFFMSLLNVYMLVNWLPTAMDAVGASLRTAIMFGVVLQLGGLLGTVPLGFLLDRYGARATMFPAYLLAAGSIALIGILAAVNLPMTAGVVFLAGFGVIGGQNAANAVAATLYPTEIRSTGVGWALGVGRVGSIIGPAFAGLLLAMHVSTRDIFLLSAFPALIAAAAAYGLGAGGARPPALGRNLPASPA